MNPFALMPYDNITLTLFTREREKEQALKRLEELEHTAHRFELLQRDAWNLRTAMDHGYSYLQHSFDIIAGGDVTQNNEDNWRWNECLFQKLREYASSVPFSTALQRYAGSISVVRCMVDKFHDYILQHNNVPEQLKDVHKELALLQATAAHLSSKANELDTAIDDLNSNISALEYDSCVIKDAAEEHDSEVDDFNERIKKLLATVRERVSVSIDDEVKYIEAEEL